MSDFQELLNDLPVLANALQSIQLHGKPREDLQYLFQNPRGIEASRAAGNQVKGETVNSCSRIGGMLSRHFNGSGPAEKMSWIGFICRDVSGDERWVMRPEVRSAIVQLGWFGPGPNVEVTPPPPVGTMPISSKEPLSDELKERAARFALVQVRAEQPAFRKAVYSAHGGRCVVTGCSVQAALEAAHLKGSDWRLGHNTAEHGVLLRRDLHALYDSGLLNFKDDGTIEITEGAMTDYASFQGAKYSQA